MNFYTLVLNSQIIKNQTVQTVPQDEYIINWDNLFQNEKATKFELSFEISCISSVSEEDDVMLSLNFQSNNHMNQLGSSSQIFGIISLTQYASNNFVRRAYMSDNSSTIINKPTNNNLVVRFLDHDESDIASFQHYVLKLKFVPIY